MKLITNQTYYLVIVYVFFLVIGGVSFYYLTDYLIREDLNKTLSHSKTMVVEQLTRSDSLLRYQRFSDNRFSIRTSDKKVKPFDIINDTLIYDGDEKVFLEYHQRHFSVEINGKYYIIWVRRLFIETVDIVAPFIITMVLFVVCIVVLFFVNRWASKKTWKPFYATLNTLKEYRFTQMDSVLFEKTNIEEFDELNAVIKQLTERLKHDFLLLKEFTENTSHELQTPLAVIKSKLELLIQSENLTDEQYKYLNVSFDSVNKMSKLNEALSLLAKIENSQFVKLDSVDFGKLIEQKLLNYEDLLEIKKIKVEKTGNVYPEIQMNLALSEVLIENLINNAIKHNVRHGYILIEAIGDEIIISNTGTLLKVDPESLFQRFSKSNSQSFGLGLSIVREICYQNNIKITYRCNKNIHTMTLKFNSIK